MGYYVDGYDENKNVWIEYDEKAHFNDLGQLHKKDIKRQQEIIKELNCKFIRISYDGKETIIE